MKLTNGQAMQALINAYDNLAISYKQVLDFDKDANFLDLDYIFSLRNEAEERLNSMTIEEASSIFSA